MEKTEVYVILRVADKSDQFGARLEVVAEPCYLENGSLGNIRYFVDYDGRGRPDLVELSTYGWLADYEKTIREDEDFYGLSEPHYRGTQINLRDAERMLKGLRAIQRKLDKANETDGYAMDPTQHLVRFARAIGAKGFIWTFPKDSTGYAMHGAYNFAAPETVRYRLQDARKEWMAKHGIEVRETSAA